MLQVFEETTQYNKWLEQVSAYVKSSYVSVDGKQYIHEVTTDEGFQQFYLHPDTIQLNTLSHERDGCGDILCTNLEVSYRGCLVDFNGSEYTSLPFIDMLMIPVVDDNYLDFTNATPVLQLETEDTELFSEVDFFV